jgi:hypothetical protein
MVDQQDLQPALAGDACTKQTRCPCAQHDDVES